MKKIRILLVDDHAMIREGLRSLLDAQTGFQVVGEAATGQQALAQVRSLHPAVVILDLSLPDGDGGRVTTEIRARFPAIRVVVLTAHDDEDSMLQLCHAGAAGYVLKQSPISELIAAIRTVAAGKVHFDTNLAGKVIVQQLSDSHHGIPGHELSEREIEVLRMVAWGHSNKEIGAALRISVKTVETYKARIAEKKHLVSRPDMVRFALGHGWLKASTPGTGTGPRPEREHP
jgi:DNA-binding NarL/FixJ family response regulator